jgi:hypothetical protein
MVDFAFMWWNVPSISVMDNYFVNSINTKKIISMERPHMIWAIWYGPYPFNTFCLIWEMWVEGANPYTPKTPPSHSWGRFSAHISQIKQKVLKGYRRPYNTKFANIAGKTDAILHFLA